MSLLVNVQVAGILLPAVNFLLYKIYHYEISCHCVLYVHRPFKCHKTAYADMYMYIPYIGICVYVCLC